MSKFLFTVLSIFIFFSHSIGQGSYKKRYFVPYEIKYEIEYYDKKGKVQTKDWIMTLDDSIKSDAAMYKLAITNRCGINIPKTKKSNLKANVGFKEKDTSGKLYVNPWRFEIQELDTGNEKIKDPPTFYYELKNRQSVKLYYKQWSANILTVPFKVRFGSNRDQYVADVNLGTLVGLTWGRSNFVHRKKIGNKVYDRKITAGFFLGASEHEFEFTDINMNNVEVSTALLSSGFGLLYAYEKFNFGILGGFDFATGPHNSLWDYHGKPWLGLSIGYSLFAF